MSGEGSGKGEEISSYKGGAEGPGVLQLLEGNPVSGQGGSFFGIRQKGVNIQTDSGGNLSLLPYLPYFSGTFFNSIF